MQMLAAEIVSDNAELGGAEVGHAGLIDGNGGVGGSCGTTVEGLLRSGQTLTGQAAEIGTEYIWDYGKTRVDLK
jgi:hypothetical protein